MRLLIRMPAMKKSGLNAKKVAYYGIAGTLCIVLSMLESLLIPMIPGLPPGAKPGLSNVVIMLLAATGQTTGLLFPVLMKSLFVLITRGITAFFTLNWINHLYHKINNRRRCEKLSTTFPIRSINNFL